MTRIIPRAALACALGLAAAACGDRVTLPAPLPASVRIDTVAAWIEVDGQVRLTATPLDAAGNPLPDATVLFSSENPEIARVDDAGMVYGVSPGVTRIVATAAPAARAAAEVTVRPKGALAVDSLTIDVPRRYSWEERYLHIEPWSVLPITLPFTVRNAAGEDLCQRVRLSISVSDTSVLSATQQRALMQPCTIVLAPRGKGGRTWVRVAAGARSDSVEVEVMWRYRPYLGHTPGSYTVGSRIRFDLLVVGPDGAPAAGVPVVFRGGYHGRQRMPPSCCIDTARYAIELEKRDSAPEEYVDAVTDGSGVAHAEWTVPTSTRFETRYRRGCGQSVCGNRAYAFAGAPFLAMAVAPSLEGNSVLLAVDSAEVGPAAPERIGVYVEQCFSHVDYTRIWFRIYDSKCEMIPVVDTAFVGTWLLPTPASVTDRYRVRVVAVALDRYGNPVGTAPTLHAVPGEFVNETYGDFGGYTAHHEEVERADVTQWTYLGSRAVLTNLAPPFTRGELTVSYPGLPSRTVTVVLTPGASWGP